MVRLQHILSRAFSIRRLFWVLVGLGHLPGLFDAWETLAVGGWQSAALGRTFGLTITTLFVALKIYDVGFLKLREGRRILISACLVVALLHVDMLRTHSETMAIPNLIALATTASIAVTPESVRRFLATCFSRVRPNKVYIKPVSPYIYTLRSFAWLPHCWFLALSLFLLRAPPV